MNDLLPYPQVVSAVTFTKSLCLPSGKETKGTITVRHRDW